MVVLATARNEPRAPLAGRRVSTGSTASQPVLSGIVEPNMDKRYQVFVSSTFEDLREERAEVMQALLELDCMPAGMELFPAASEEQWSWITKVIDESDYYLVIVGGKYGSIHSEKQLSFTELEYRYALEVGKPVIAFLHGSPSAIPAGKTEDSPEKRALLLEFRQQCQQRLCKYWSTPSDLGGKVSRSMLQLMKRHPAVGWIRADYLPDDQKITILELQKKLAEATEKLRQSSIATVHYNSLASGDDPFEIEFYFETKVAKASSTGSRYWVGAEGFWTKFETTWNSIAQTIGEELLTGAQDSAVMDALNDSFRAMLPEGTEGIGKDKIVSGVKISSDIFAVIKAQFIALGLVNVERVRGGNYWTLTALGRGHILNVLTVKKIVADD